MPFFFHLLTNDRFQGDVLNRLQSNLLLVRYHYFHGAHLIEGRLSTALLNHEKLFDVNQNLLVVSFKKYIFTILFFPN